MKKILMLFIAAILVSGMLFAGGANDSKNTEDGKVTISVYWWGNQVRNDLTQKAINLYMEEHPDIIINAEFADWSGYWGQAQRNCRRWQYA